MISWAVETLVATSLLMLVVLALRGPVGKHFGPRIAYALWLLPAFRMILPPLPETVAPRTLQMLPSPMGLELLLMAPVPSAAPQAATIDWGMFAAVAWTLGALAFLGWHLLSYRRFLSRTLEDATQLPRLDRDGVEVCASPVAKGPFAAGIFLKTVVLPEDYRRRYASEELRLAIEHEVQHHRRCDMSANFAALIVLALNWWNPIAYFAHRAFRADQELACDALVLARATPDERHAYGSALLKSACDRLPVAACALGAGDDLKRRLKMMKTYRADPKRARLGGLIASGLVGGGLLLTASGGIAAETSKEVEQQVRTALAPIVPALAPDAPPAPPAPLPPAMPAAPEAVKLALLHPHPAPVPPVAAVPPVPPVPPVPYIDASAIARHASAAAVAAAQAAGEAVDHDEIAREVREALEEARRDAEEARREALQDAAEARREAEQARREGEQARREGEQARREGERARAEAARVRTVVRSGVRINTSDYCGAAGARVHVSDNGDKTVTCLGWSEKDKAEMRKTMLVSLKRARTAIVSMDQRHMPDHARMQALESLDRQIERLRAGN
jgi:beta-lactamase regulating signal transducer with metallopeptidase domain/Skp family chaperone for outer membrane proteins